MNSTTPNTKQYTPSAEADATVAIQQPLPHFGYSVQVAICEYRGNVYNFVNTPQFVFSSALATYDAWLTAIDEGDVTGVSVAMVATLGGSNCDPDAPKKVICASYLDGDARIAPDTERDWFAPVAVLTADPSGDSFDDLRLGGITSNPLEAARDESEDRAHIASFCAGNLEVDEGDFEPPCDMDLAGYNPNARPGDFEMGECYDSESVQVL